MAGWHQTIVIGYVGKDAQMQYTQTGIAVTGFSVAVTEVWKDKNSGEKREKTTWYNVSVWNKMAEICSQYVRKGMQIMIKGSVSAQGYTNNAGEVTASLKLDAREVKFLGNRKDGDQSETTKGVEEQFQPPPTNPDDVPF